MPVVDNTSDNLVGGHRIAAVDLDEFVLFHRFLVRVTAVEIRHDVGLTVNDDRHLRALHASIIARNLKYVDRFENSSDSQTRSSDVRLEKSVTLK